MKKIFNSVLIIVITIMTFSTFQSCKSVKTIEKSQLEGNWILRTLNNENATDAFKETVPTLKFDFSENTISGNGGCNSYSGVFTLSKNNEFLAPNVVSTMRACFEANKEPQYYKALSDPGLTLSIEGETLSFLKKNEIIMQFAKTVDNTDSDGNIITKRLTGNWILNSIGEGDMETLFSTKKPTMNIDAEGKITGNAGCNTYRTSYTLDGNNITFAPVVSTKMACPDLKGENLFTSHLESPLQVVADENKINLYKGSVLVLGFVRNTETE
ncbi:MAG: META domain-containing protein [Prevotella sp.]|jgi:heat shock protein HslJ|nr:META domain-containing protein [Prevotella sp.]